MKFLSSTGRSKLFAITPNYIFKQSVIALTIFWQIILLLKYSKSLFMSYLSEQMMIFGEGILSFNLLKIYLANYTD